MRIEPSAISPRLRAMLEKVGRPGLAIAGFDVDDATLAKSRALSPHDPEHAIFHALFDPSAPHAAVVNPPPPSAADEKQWTDGAKAWSESLPPPAFMPYDPPSQVVHWVAVALLAAILATLLAGHAKGQPSSPLVLQLENGGSLLGSVTSGLLKLNCASATYVAGVYTCTSVASSGGSYTLGATNFLYGSTGGWALGTVPGSVRFPLLMPSVTGSLHIVTMPGTTGAVNEWFMQNAADTTLTNSGNLIVGIAGGVVNVQTNVFGAGTPVTEQRFGEYSGGANLLTWHVQFNGVNQFELTPTSISVPTASGMTALGSAALSASTAFDASGAAATAQAAAIAASVSLTGSYSNPSWITGLAYSKLSGAPTIPTVTGGTCTNQVATAISGSAVPTCTTVTSAYVDSSIAPTSSPTLVTPAITTSATTTNNSLTTTIADGAVLQNTTPSLVGTTAQYSPALHWIGHVWKSNSTAIDQQVDFQSFLLTKSQGTAGEAILAFIPTLAGVAQKGIGFCSGGTAAVQTVGTYITGLDGSGVTGTANGYNCDSNVGFTGFGPAGTSNVFAVYNNATARLNFTVNGTLFNATAGVMFASGGPGNATTGDTTLDRDAAGVLGVQSGAPGATLSNYRDLKLRHSVASGTAPTIASGGGGTGAAINGADQSGVVTVGTTVNTGAVVVTFGTAFPLGLFDCHATDQSNAPTIEPKCTTLPYAGVGSGTYTSGITTTGTATQTCTLTITGGGGTGATATVALTGTNTIAGGTALVITAAGSGFVSQPTGASITNGTATCSGTAVIASVLSTTGLVITGYSSTTGLAGNFTASDVLTWSIPWTH